MIFILSLQDIQGENNLVKTLLRIGVSSKNMPGKNWVSTSSSPTTEKSNSSLNPKNVISRYFGNGKKKSIKPGHVHKIEKRGIAGDISTASGVQIPPRSTTTNTSLSMAENMFSSLDE